IYTATLASIPLIGSIRLDYRTASRGVAGAKKSYQPAFVAVRATPGTGLDLGARLTPTSPQCQISYAICSAPEVSTALTTLMGPKGTYRQRVSPPMATVGSRSTTS